MQSGLTFGVLSFFSVHLNHLTLGPRLPLLTNGSSNIQHLARLIPLVVNNDTCISRKKHVHLLNKLNLPLAKVISAVDVLR